ncbi:MAG: ATP-dependent DNA ligase [Patescibacteria group bacterium]
MKFSLFANYLQKLEETTKRLEMTDILTELISKLNPEETDKAIYLASGYLEAPFEGIKFNTADKLMIKIMEQTFSTPENIKGNNLKNKIQTLYRKSGDLGSVVYELKGLKQKSKDLSITEVYERLYEITQIEGTGSQDLKLNKISSLLNDLEPLSAKHVTRIILGTMRLGFTELTIIAALANYLKNKSLSKDIESKYNIYPDIGFIARKIRGKGIKGIKDINMETGVPILSQKCQRVSGIEEIPERIKHMWAEFKFDGTRVQLHFDRGKKIKKTKDFQSNLFGSEKADKKEDIFIKSFTRNLEDTTHQYPEIIAAAKKQIKADSVILDGEGIGFNKETGEFLPFQETMQRKRKYNIAETAKDIPFKYFVFDILYLDGKSLIDKSLKERRGILTKIILPGEVIKVDEYLETDEFEDLEEYFQKAKSLGLEGIVVKTPEKAYEAGARSYSWVKYKTADRNLLSDSIDCVVLGYYNGKGARSKFGIGGFLVGIYDDKKESFKTISKIGTGLTEEDWVKLKTMCDKIKIKEKPLNVEMNKTFKPNVFVKPSLVVEIGADEISISPTHTAGYALRFPRLLKFREDKKPTQATTLKEIEKMYIDRKKQPTK